jgi:spore germination protein KC
VRVNRTWALVLLVVAALFAGCWDRTELEDQAYIVYMGVDKDDGDQLLVTALVAVTQSLAPGGQQASGGGGRQFGFQLLTARAHTITDAINTMNTAVGRRLVLKHLRGVQLGEPLSRAGAEPVVMELFRSPLARTTVLMSQARGRAFDVISHWRPFEEANPGRAPEALLLAAKQLHLYPPSRMHHFISRLAAPGGDPFVSTLAVNPGITADVGEPVQASDGHALAGELPRGGGNPVEHAGTAIFSRDKLAGFLSVDETHMLLSLRGEGGKSYITFPDPSDPRRMVTIRYQQENLPKFNPSYQRGKPHVQVRLLYEGEVLAVPGGTDYVPAGERVRLEQAAADHAETLIRELLVKLRDWGADPVGFGNIFRRKFATWDSWVEYDWRKRVPDLTVDVSVKMRIRRYGLYTGPDRVRGGK